MIEDVKWVKTGKRSVSFRSLDPKEEHYHRLIGSKVMRAEKILYFKINGKWISQDNIRTEEIEKMESEGE